MDFSAFFRSLSVPVIVCRADENLSVAYLNQSAAIRFAPLDAYCKWEIDDKKTPLSNVLGISADDYKGFLQALSQKDEVSGFYADLRLSSGERLLVMLSANRVKLVEGEFVFIFTQTCNESEPRSASEAIAYLSERILKEQSTENAIKTVLAFAGEYTGVSRVYVFEAISDTLTSNTYEWCADNVLSTIDALQEISKEVYSYDDVISQGLIATDDISTLRPGDRAMLEPQGVKSIAVAPLLSQQGALGCVGFDDCDKHRKWSQEDINFLLNVADILASLMVRRNKERQLQYGLKTLRTVMDHSNNLITVTDIHTNKLLFVNTVFALDVGQAPEDLIGQFSNTVLRSWASNAKDYDPLSELIGEDGRFKKETLIWEFHNQSNQKWYRFRDTIIKWTDGRDVLLEIATDITVQKRQEEKLRREASTDSMTGLFLRERGRQIIRQILDEPSNGERYCLVFIDLDHLKHINDKYGHHAGDRMILKTIEIILSCINRSDTLCRWGGDEFVLILGGGADQTEKTMRGIEEQVAEYNATGQESFPIGFSYGIAEIVPGGQQTVDTLVAEADRKMYRHKTASGGH